MDETQAFRTAVMQVLSAVRAYLPPDGIGFQEFSSRVIEAVDNPEINPFIFAWELAQGEKN